MLLSAAFALYSTSIYLQPSFSENKCDINEQAANGRLVWQKYNCQSCHQLYGLGGYLGPDLTNIYSAPGKGETYIKAMLRAGVSQMPSFELLPEEEEQLICFLRETDKSGKADPRSFSSDKLGMIHKK